MIWLFLGTIYGIGFGLTMIGGVLYTLILGGLHTDVHPLKLLASIVFWPITWGYMALKFWWDTQ